MTPEKQAWLDLNRRCSDKNWPRYKDWGGRGISVYPRWVYDYEDFLAHVGFRPSPEHSIDRISNDGNYVPGNVKWSTRKEQRANRRESNFKTGTYFYENVKGSFSGVCKSVGVCAVSVKRRMRLFGWTFSQAIFYFVQKKSW